MTPNTTKTQTDQKHSGRIRQPLAWIALPLAAATILSGCTVIPREVVASIINENEKNKDKVLETHETSVGTYTVHRSASGTYYVRDQRGRTTSCTGKRASCALTISELVRADAARDGGGGGGGEGGG